MSSGYIPAKDEPEPEEILDALREAIFDNPRLTEMPAEEVARQLILGGYLQKEPSPALVADMLDALEADEEGFEADELSEEGNPDHRLRVEHDRATLLVHLSDEDGGGWTVMAVDRATRRWAVAQARRQLDAAQAAIAQLYPGG